MGYLIQRVISNVHARSRRNFASRRAVVAAACMALGGIPGIAPIALAEGARPAHVDVHSTIHDPAGFQAAHWAPAHPLAVARLVEPDKHAGKLREYLNESGFYDSAAFQLLSSNPGLMQAQIGLLGLAATAGMDGWTALGHVLGQDAVVGLYGGAPGAKPGLLIVAVARDAGARTKFINAAATAAGLMKGGKPDPDKSVTVDGRTIFSAGNVCFASDGDALLIASTQDLIKTAMGVKAGSGESLSASGELDTAEDSAPQGAMAYATVDVQKIMDITRADGKPADGLVENPLGGFLFGGWTKSIVDAKSAVAWMEDLTDGLSLTALVERGAPLPPSHKGFAVNFGDLAVDWSNVKLPHQIASISIGRDWASLFGERESILTTAGATQAAAFAATMTTLMGNMDFLEDFLPRVSGPVHFYLEGQDFSSKGYEPAPVLPAFALVAPLKGASEDMLRQRLMSGSQMAVSFINFDAAQKQQPGFLLGLAEHRGVSILKGTYPPPGTPAGGEMMKDSAKKGEHADQGAAMQHDAASAKSGEPVNARYNFEAVVAVAKDHYLVATSVETMKSLIDAVLDAKPSQGSAGFSADEVRVEGGRTTEILHQNREELIVQRMLEQDEDRAQAEHTIDALLAITGKIDHVSLVSRPTQTGQEATLKISLRRGKFAPAGASDGAATSTEGSKP